MHNSTKRSVIKLLFFMTRLTFLVIVVSLTLTGVIFASGAKSQNINDYRVTVNKKGASLEEVLNSFEKQSPFTFTYATGLGKSILVDVNIDNQPLSESLMVLKSVAKLNFKQINSTITVARMSLPPPP